MRWRPLPAFAAIDFLSCLLVVFVAVALPSQPPQVKTYGAYAVVITWPKGRNDVDLFVRDPEGAVSYFAKAQADQMQLEHDDRGTAATGYTHSHQNEERTVLRSASSGEWIANILLYARQQGPAPRPCWRSRSGGSCRSATGCRPVLAPQTAPRSWQASSRRLPQAMPVPSTFGPSRPTPKLRGRIGCPTRGSSSEQPRTQRAPRSKAGLLASGRRRRERARKGGDATRSPPRGFSSTGYRRTAWRRRIPPGKTAANKREPTPDPGARTNPRYELMPRTRCQ